MSENFTQSEGLVQEVSLTGWLSGPEGQQGFEVVVLKKMRTGSVYIRTLKPGQGLDISERLLSSHIALAVDLRAGRYFKIHRDFDVYERGRSVNIDVNIRYRVTDVANVAMNHIDSLGELRDKVIALLNRELKMHRESNITSKTIEGLIRGIEHTPELGLMVVGAEVINFKGDVGVTNAIVNNDNLDYQISIDQRKLDIELDAKRRQAGVDREIKEADEQANLRIIQKKISAINLTNLNNLFHMHPNMIPQIYTAFTERELKLLDMKIGLIGQAVSAYIRDQNAVKGEIDSGKIVKIMRDFLPTTHSDHKRLTNGDIIFEEDEPGFSSNMNDDIIYDEL